MHTDLLIVFSHKVGWHLTSFPIQESESLTKLFEADGRTGLLFIREYVKLKKSLQHKIDACTSRSDPLLPIYHAMLERVKSYLKEALKSEVLVLATILHPCWQADFFQFAFDDYSYEFKTAKTLIETAFENWKAQHEEEAGKNINTNKHNSNDGEDQDDDGFRAHRKKLHTQSENELCNYLERVDEPSKQVEKDPNIALEWWKVKSLFMISLIYDWTDCLHLVLLSISMLQNIPS